MNIINVKVNFTKGTCETSGINLITGDYNSTKMVFEFDREDGTKIFEMKSPSENLVMVKEIQNNEIPLYALTDEDEIASLFTEDGYYVFEISLYENESKLTSAKGKIKVKPEQVVIDGEVVEAYLPIFDQLLSEVNTALTETGNLDISVSKSGKTATITLTDKDGESHTVQILDGEQGPQGEPGVPGAVKSIVVDILPTENIDTTAIYLVPSSTPGTSNTYDEYMYINNNWEKIGGNLVIDLTNYVKNTDYATSSVGGVIKTDSGLGTTMASNGVIKATEKTYSQYTSLSSQAFISKGTLENVITGKGLTTKSYVDGLVGDIQTLLDNLDSGSGV